jgi:hypothetical protein
VSARAARAFLSDPALLSVSKYSIAIHVIFDGDVDPFTASAIRKNEICQDQMSFGVWTDSRLLNSESQHMWFTCTNTALVWLWLQMTKDCSGRKLASPRPPCWLLTALLPWSVAMRN